MDEVFTRLQQEIEQHRSAVLLSIISSKGSAPRHEGTHQLILSDGHTVGTIGGGFQEFKACEQGRRCLAGRNSSVVKLKLHADTDGDIGAVCGGELTVLCQYIPAGMPYAAACLERIKEAAQTHSRCWLVLAMPASGVWSMAVVSHDIVTCGAPSAVLQHMTGQEEWLGRSCKMLEMAGSTVYCEPLSSPGRVFVFGGGHVAHALVPVLLNLAFSCVVIDDRAEFANAARFPGAETIIAEYTALPDTVHITSDDYVCIMTRGHGADYEVQRQVMPYHPAYVGVIGSKGKLAFVKEKLLAAGITPAEIDRCYAPIGLPISAATPEEIAVSIAAELIAVRARREGREKANTAQWLKR
ncbi:MAG: XdhC family protein [Megasphaera sp.]|jgi:xanthine dehydrogenase accessory factor|nr:XdhC family protein [Megasphaera sp.]MCH4187349.1 XdhC family protein [Megasphaera sp.]MCH4217531.1 XdhC family protein [Megasphaera sp.]